MKKLKILAALLLVAALCLSMTACGLEKSDVVGTWSASWTYNGNAFDSTFVLSSNGTFLKVTYKNGTLSSMEEGPYVIEGREVILKPTDSLAETHYDYRNGKLVNNGHKFTRS